MNNILQHMRENIKQIVESVVEEILNEDKKEVKPTYYTVPPQFDEKKGANFLAKQYDVDPNNLKYLGGGRFEYKPIKKRYPKKEKQFMGKTEDMSDAEYLDRVRELNRKFAEEEKEIPGEDWRPIRNSGRYFGGATDYTKTHEVSNMGRIRTIDMQDPMRSKISTGYDAPTRNSRQFHLDSYDDSGRVSKTTPPIHTIVADAWLEKPEGNIKDYDVEHIDGDYHNNRADNLRYVLRKGKRGNNMRNENQTHFIKQIVNETIKKFIKESNETSLDEEWNSIKKKLGAENMLNDIFQHLGKYELEELINFFHSEGVY